MNNLILVNEFNANFAVLRNYIISILKDSPPSHVEQCQVFNYHTTYFK